MTPHPEEPKHPLEGKLEPECKNVQTPTEAAMLSIAISLKRIADEISFFNINNYNRYR